MSTTRWSTTSCRLFVVGMLGAALSLAGCGDEKPTPRRARTEKTEGVASGKSAEGGSDKPVATEGWGHLTGRFILQGTVPPLKEIVVTQNPEYCNPFKAAGEVRNETVVVNAKNELKNVVVYLRHKPERVHEDYQQTATGEVVLDNRHCRFEPHICLLRTTQKLRVKNSDIMGHNTKYGSLIQGFNENVPVGGGITKELKVEERTPTEYRCDVHKWMNGYLVLLSHPYMAVSKDDGTFEIKNLPAGTWEFQFWHEGPGPLEIGEWKGGRAKFAIEDKKTTPLGEIKVPVESLKLQP